MLWNECKVGFWKQRHIQGCAELWGAGALGVKVHRLKASCRTWVLIYHISVIDISAVKRIQIWKGQGSSTVCHIRMRSNRHQSTSSKVLVMSLTRSQGGVLSKPWIFCKCQRAWLLFFFWIELSRVIKMSISFSISSHFPSLFGVYLLVPTHSCLHCTDIDWLWAVESANRRCALYCWFTSDMKGPIFTEWLVINSQAALKCCSLSLYLFIFLKKSTQSEKELTYLQENSSSSYRRYREHCCRSIHKALTFSRTASLTSSMRHLHKWASI